MLSIAEIETNFLKTERPGSLLQRFAKQKKLRIWYSITPAHYQAGRMALLSALMVEVVRSIL